MEIPSITNGQAPGLVRTPTSTENSQNTIQIPDSDSIEISAEALQLLDEQAYSQSFTDPNDGGGSGDDPSGGGPSTPYPFPGGGGGGNG